MIRRLGVAMSVAMLIMLVIPWTALAIHSDESVTQANATLRVADRTIVATARLAETQEGLNIQVEATGLTPGLHGIHIHAVASCVPADFTSAGGHYNPDGSQHGTENPEGPHAGDLPNIEIGADGTGTLDVTTEMISLSGENTLFDVDGSALVIHAGADDMATDPAGNSGARVACGEIVPGDVELGDDCEYFAVTQHSLCDEFLAFWEANGGLAVFGYPLTDAFDEENPDTGEVYLVQYFERQRFELHPENAGTVYEVLLGRLGAEILELQGRNWFEFDEADPSDPHYFAETGHAIAPEFWEYWSSHGLEYGDPGTSMRESLLLFGYPISEPMTETNMDGDTVLTQWFERAVFEYHPDNDADNQILLRRLGAELLELTQPEPEPQFEVVAEGLDNPRHLSLGPDGGLYVAESGRGGDDCIMVGEGEQEQKICTGPTSAVSIVMDEGAVEVLSGLPSQAGPGGSFATGTSDAIIDGDGIIWAVTGGAGDPDVPADDILAGFSKLVMGAPNGDWIVVADLGEYESEVNPGGEQDNPITGEPGINSNPYALTMEGDDLYVIDAGGNDLLRVTQEGEISTFAVFPHQEIEMPDGSTAMIDSVPTSIVKGPDGAFYVGELGGEAGGPPGAHSRIWRVMDENSDGDARDEGETTVHMTGFFSIIDLDFADDGTLYVLQIFSLTPPTSPDAPPAGALIRVAADGTRTVLASEGLVFPTGLEVMEDGLYVSNFGTFAEAGQIVRIAE